LLLWNRITSQTLSTRNQITEQAIQNALGKIVTDRVQLPDMADNDNDRLWVSDAALRPYDDTTSRFSAYYSKRLAQSDPGPIDAIQRFIEAMNEFLNEGNDGWGVHDHMEAKKCWGRAECHPCCWPKKSDKADEDKEEIRPVWCKEHPEEVWEVACRGDGLMNASTYYEPYQWEFDPVYEEPNKFGNEFYSFRELIGNDDEKRDYYKDNEVDFLRSTWNPNRIPQRPMPPRTIKGWYLEDATNYYVRKYGWITTPEEYRKGVYPWFHKMSDWGLELSTIAKPVDPQINPRPCYLCDVRDTADCIDCYDEANWLGELHPHPYEIPQLDLPLDPLVDCMTIGGTERCIEYNTSYWVDPDTDIITYPKYIFADPEVCAEFTAYPDTDPDLGFWKEGADYFCSTVFPYELPWIRGPGDVDCLDDYIACPNDRDPTNTTYDTIDTMQYGLIDFIMWAEPAIEQAEENLAKFAADFTVWYPEVAKFIEGDVAGCYLICDDPEVYPNEGHLNIFLHQMQEMILRFKKWYDNDDLGYVGATCGEAWCVPPEDLDPTDNIPAACGVAQDELDAMFLNGEVYGDVEDIVNCLDHNVNGLGATGAIGNADRFQACFDMCSACLDDPFDPANCTDLTNAACGGLDTDDDGLDDTYLPRSMVPGFDPNAAFVPIEVEYVQELIQCPTRCASCDTTAGSCVSERAACDDKCNSDYSACVEPLFSDPTYTTCIAPCTTCTPCTGPGDPNDPFCQNFLACVQCQQGCNTILDGLITASTCPTTLSSCLTNNCSTLPDTCENTCENPKSTCEDGCNDDETTCESDCVVNCLAGCGSCTPCNPTDPLFALCLPSWQICQSAVFLCQNGCVNGSSAQQCLNNCSTDKQTCMTDCSLLSTECSSSDCYCEKSLAAPPEVPDFNFSCSDVLPGATAPNPYTDALDLARHDCGVPNNTSGVPADDTFLDLIARSIPEATNQVAKFGVRLNYLKNRLEEFREVLDIFETAEGQFNTFLSGPAAELIAARAAFDPNSIGLPRHATYGWQDPPPDDGSATRGKWHIVKVEARIPENCDSACGPNQALDSDPEWPRIKTRTKWFGSRRCYKLSSREGVVKFRVVRYDEEAEPGDLTFPNDEPIWQFRQAHPERPSDPTVDPDQLDANCAASMINSIPDGTPGGTATNIYDGAFMMARFDASTNTQCWNLANRLLSQGVVSEACAYYHWTGGQMTYRFIDCRAF